MKVCSIVGARPQFVKLAPFSQELRKYHKEIVIHTGQHYQANMSDLFFQELNIPKPDYELGIGSYSQGVQTGKMLAGIEKVLLKEQPDLAVIFGDTNSTLAGVMAAVKLGIKTVHIEAGLRSFNRSMPEEINRLITDCVSDYLFVPTETAMKNLANEGLKGHLTGDIMVDSIKIAKEKTGDRKELLSAYKINKKDYYLMTLHRQSNVDDKIELNNILININKLDKKVLFPIHPRTRKNIAQVQEKNLSNIVFCNPFGYFDFLYLMINAAKIITDSGGIQKEAYILKVPCITLRNETEWVETVQSGWNVLAQTDDVVETILRHKAPAAYDNLFGENPAQTMVDLINKL